MNSVRGKKDKADEPEKLQDIRCNIILFFVGAVVIAGINLLISYYVLNVEVPVVGTELEYLGQLAEWEMQPIVEIKVSEPGAWCGDGWGWAIKKKWNGLDYACTKTVTRGSGKSSRKVCVRSIGPIDPIGMS